MTAVPMPESETPSGSAFLEKIKLQSGLDDVYDARDVSEVVFRTMRDLMPNSVVDRVTAELDKPALNASQSSHDRALQCTIADLWRDTNPLVRIVSRLRQPLIFDAETFLFRVQQEGGIQRGVSAETVVRAVFAATKPELSQERINEIAEHLPDQIKQLWIRA